MLTIWYFTWLVFDVRLALLVWATLNALLALFAVRIPASSC